METRKQQKQDSRFRLSESLLFMGEVSCKYIIIHPVIVYKQTHQWSSFLLLLGYKKKITLEKGNIFQITYLVSPQASAVGYQAAAMQNTFPNIPFVPLPPFFSRKVTPSLSSSSSVTLSVEPSSTFQWEQIGPSVVFPGTWRKQKAWSFPPRSRNSELPNLKSSSATSCVIADYLLKVTKSQFPQLRYGIGWLCPFVK